jgi:hypothetical protein
MIGENPILANAGPFKKTIISPNPQTWFRIAEHGNAG